jgi:hypothetical protein
MALGGWRGEQAKRVTATVTFRGADEVPPTRVSLASGLSKYSKRNGLGERL